MDTHYTIKFCGNKTQNVKARRFTQRGDTLEFFAGTRETGEHVVAVVNFRHVHSIVPHVEEPKPSPPPRVAQLEKKAEKTT